MTSARDHRPLPIDTRPNHIPIHDLNTDRIERFRIFLINRREYRSVVVPKKREKRMKDPQPSREPGSLLPMSLRSLEKKQCKISNPQSLYPLSAFFVFKILILVFVMLPCNAF